MSRFRFRISHLLYAVALLAAGTATLGPWGAGVRYGRRHCVDSRLLQSVAPEDPGDGRVAADARQLLFWTPRSVPLRDT